MRNGGNRQEGRSENRSDDWDGTRQEGGFRHTILCTVSMSRTLFSFTHRKGVNSIRLRRKGENKAKATNRKHSKTRKPNFVSSESHNGASGGNTL